MAQEHVGFWKRFLAYLIDGVILGIVSGILLGVLGNNHIIIVNCISAIICFLYFPLMESSSLQGTIGKHALGLKVVDYYYERVSTGRAFGRYFSKILSGMILYIGYMMVGWTEKKQGLHDMIASTYVIKK